MPGRHLVNLMIITSHVPPDVQLWTDSSDSVEVHVNVGFWDPETLPHKFKGTCYTIIIPQMTACCPGKRVTLSWNLLVSTGCYRGDTLVSTGPWSFFNMFTSSRQTLRICVPFFRISLHTDSLQVGPFLRCLTSDRPLHH